MTKKIVFISWIHVFILIIYQLLLFTPDLSALDPAAELTRYHIRVWSIKDGLPHNTITALLQSQNGYIWIGTPAGLVRFDGVRFTVLNRKNTSIIKNDHISALYEDPQKTLWIGTAGGGFYSLQNGNWNAYTSSNGLSNNQVRTITMDVKGNLWLGTDYGLNLYQSGQFRVFTKDDGLDDNIITALCTDFQGRVWVGSLSGGLARFKDGRFTIYNYKNGLLNPFIFSLTHDRLGNIWIGTQQGLFYYDGQEDIISSFPGMSFTPVTALVTGQQNSLWIGTMADGLKRLYKTRISEYSSDQGFPDDYIHCLLQDREGYLWIGTESEGIVQLKETMISNITRAEGLPENAVCTVIEDDDNTFWAGMYGTGLCQIKDGRFQQLVSTKNGLSSNYTRTLFKDASGRLWIGTDGGGLNLFDSGKVKQITDQKGKPAYSIPAICQDQKGNLWIASDQGLALIQNGRIEYQTTDSTLVRSPIQVLLPSASGVLYLGTRTGLFTFQNHTLQKSGSDSTGADWNIVSLYEDSAGTLWIGTNGNGIICWRNHQFFSITSGQGLPDDHIYSITEDPNHNFWFSSDKGVFMIRLPQLEDLRKNRISFLVPAWYDQAQGMISRQCSKGCQPAGMLFSSGRLYYPTSRGISVFDLTKMDTSVFTIEPILESVAYNNENIPVTEPGITFPAGDDLEIRFTAFEYSAPEKIYFQYQLQGIDYNFIPVFPGTDRRVRYSHLPDGRYNFMVKTAGNGGTWSRAKKLIEITIRHPFYRTTDFYLVALIFLAILSVMGIRFISKQKVKDSIRIKYQTSSLDPVKTEELVQKLSQIMDKDRIFLNPDLTLTALAHQLHIHQNHLSRIINERFNLNFNDYINQYRIKEVCRRFESPEDRGKTILEIMYECGFYSKSVFNTAFKKFTGITPSEYRKEPANPDHLS